MNSLKEIIRMIFPAKKSSENNMEQGHAHPNFQSMSTTLPEQELPHVDHNGRPTFSPDDQLNLFRHLVGITSHSSMAHAHFGDQSGGRPAPNLGIYARVVHNESTSKAGYKYFSWLINGCLGLQIVVAAALTAMGAAGASRSAVTVFGAINTVIAGVLTFLKGSGLPNRFKYYQTEWKRVREFIEQRERDFSRPGCDLDLYGIVGIIEQMYEDVKIDLEASQPDRFAGSVPARKMMANQVEAPKTSQLISSSLPQSATAPLSEKFLESGFGSKVSHLASDIGQKADLARAAVKEFQDRKEHISEDASRGLREYADRAERLETSFGDKVKDLASDIGNRAQLAPEAAQNLQARQRSEVEEVGREARDYMSQFERTASGKLKGPISISMSGTPATQTAGEKSHMDTAEGAH
ncbi:hypothetical protein D0Z07_2103 [Hyphodiscus hymeniophilus]|uniref:SMODS and SLOG-associating 2TM effector domain-containing protein n=1 Tax=Hyphodiscus hymeniophilus TaxID=353542 RepID=A0A9P7AZH8_9HELO|nr:hypothetical protein D0Z07_2103 [Hyphodiscus hymeniophilus]